MSSAILYLAIVAIWAVVLVPRWLRRPHPAPQWAEMHEEETDPAGVDAGDAPPGEEAQPAAAGTDAIPAPARVSLSSAGRRARVLRTRRWTLLALALLTAGAVTLAAAGLAAWWVALPPVAMLAGFLLLLRAAAQIDAERAAAVRSAHAGTAARAERARHGERTAPASDSPAAPAAAEPAGEAGHGIQTATAGMDAEIIDISARVADQLYDQYTDAEARAIGD